MFTLLNWEQFSVTEKLNLELAKYYTRLWKDAGGDKRYRKMFGGKNRIYIPLEDQTTIDYFSDIIDDIERALEDLGYEPLSIEGNWAKQIKGRREKKITKVLSSDKEKRYEDLNREYLKILDLHKRAQEDLYEIVISKHGYDIAGMSADRGWDSCMNVLKDKGKEYVEVDIEEGSIIAYLIKKKDRNIQNPRARLLIKPFISDDGKEIVLFADKSVQGTDLDGFRETVEKWLEENQTITKYKYNLLQDIYDDGLNVICNPHIINGLDYFLDSIVKGKWDINDERFISVEGDVDIEKKHLSKEKDLGNIFAKYYLFYVNGNLTISGIGITRLFLKGKGRLWVRKNFNCSHNKLKTLEGGPTSVLNIYNCMNNKLTDLKGCAKYIGETLMVDDNKLKSLEGCPEEIGNNLSITGNPSIKTLKGFPKFIGNNLYIDIDFPFADSEIREICNIEGDIIRMKD